VDDFAKKLLQYITDNGGRISFTDKSDANDIYETFEVSKKTFKKAVGDLYKKRLIIIEEDGIRLADNAK
jgi:predicted RNA-binding protein (virulence factor B family)